VSSDCFGRKRGSWHLGAGEDAFTVAAFHFNANVTHLYAVLQRSPSRFFQRSNAAGAARDLSVVCTVRANDTGFQYVILLTRGASAGEALAAQTSDALAATGHWPPKHA
jgi:hypothetical protein